MTRESAKALLRPMLARIAKKTPQLGWLVECGGHTGFFRTQREAMDWYQSLPEYLKGEVNEMPTIQHGWFTNV